MNCKICKSKFIKTKSFQTTCGPVCFWELTQKVLIEKRKKDWIKEKQVRKEKLMTLSDWKAKLQIEINTIVRLIDKGVGCIATGVQVGKMNAGHYISRGANETIRFNLHNIFLQSEHSNSFKAGDTIRFQDGLRRIYGIEYFEMVESLRQTGLIKLSIEEINDKIIIARLIVKELKGLENIYTSKERIELRTEMNFRLGIYKNNLFDN